MTATVKNMAGRLRRGADPRVWIAKVRVADERSRKALGAVGRLRARVDALEREVMECRNMNKRLAEVIDVFVEVLVPAEHRDVDRLERVLDEYAQTIVPDLTDVERPSPFVGTKPAQ